MRSISFTYTCPNCDNQVEAKFTPGTPPVYYLRNGDPGHPGDDAEIECEEEDCPTCGEPITDELLMEQGEKAAAEYEEAAEEAAAEARHDAHKDRYIE